jgi:hypothetical protein
LDRDAGERCRRVRQLLTQRVLLLHQLAG